jgi:WD40 repeat protein
MAFSPDGRQLVSSFNDDTMRLWDTRIGKCLQTLEGHGSWVLSVIFSLNRRQLVLSSHDHIVHL